ncbi:FecR family protein [Chitinophaga caseinilytica]|uniref:FecR family protein n=1 Tax=Chitinophaga caseinilytica TaxID=2267521 RepID=UPI003C2B6BA4
MNEYAVLYRKLMDNDCSPEEVDRLVAWLSEEAAPPLAGELIFEQLDRSYEEPMPEDLRLRLESRLRNILGHEAITAREPRFRKMRTWGWAAAAAVLIGISVWFLRPEKKSSVPSAQLLEQISPGSNGAVLTLADGRQVRLDSLENDTIGAQAGALVAVRNGQLTYDPSAAGGNEVQFNTTATPRGRQYQLRLPDGTKVWLNAASSLRYPTAFNGGERRVEITGEAYFEVAKDKTKPFRAVVNGGTTVEVLGTEFNINAYPDDGETKTTLLRGSVKVVRTSGTVTLVPGQQANVKNGVAVVREADTDKAVAWKNGLFDFDGMPLEEAMRQLARWYDITIVYEKGIPDIRFYGAMSRDVSLAGMLKGLEGAGVRFRMEEGRKLVVYP